MTRPLIGLTGRPRLAGQVSGFVPSTADQPVDVYVQAYARGVLEAGGLPVFLPGFVDPAEYVGHLDGVLLTGGADMDPARYGADSEPGLGRIEPERDVFELGLVDVAVADDLPILGICRGIQVLNVWAGGTLHQHVPDHARWDVPTNEIVDEVHVEPGTVLHDLYGPTRPINSLHHQTLDRVADGWRVSARSADGVIEALEWPGRDVVAVQWHPEMLDDRPRDPLFRWLVERAAARANRRDVGAAV